MSAIEQLPGNELPRLSAPAAITHTVLQSFNTSKEGTVVYRPDYMTQEFAMEVAKELEELGVTAIVVATWLKNAHKREVGQSYALELPHNVVPLRNFN